MSPDIPQLLAFLERAAAIAFCVLMVGWFLQVLIAHIRMERSFRPDELWDRLDARCDELLREPRVSDRLQELIDAGERALAGEVTKGDLDTMANADPNDMFDALLALRESDTADTDTGASNR